MASEQVKTIVEYAEEIRIIRFTCAFCSHEDDFERDQFNGKTKEEVAEILVGEGWKEITADSLEGLACPACVEENK